MRMLCYINVSAESPFHLWTTICVFSITTETGRLFFRRRRKQLPLARKENVLGHVALNTRKYIPSRCVAQFFLRASSQSSIFGFRCWYNMIWIKVFYNNCFPKDRCEVIKTNENNVATCNDLMQILQHKLEYRIYLNTCHPRISAASGTKKLISTALNKRRTSDVETVTSKLAERCKLFHNDKGV